MRKTKYILAAFILSLGMLMYSCKQDPPSQGTNVEIKKSPIRLNSPANNAMYTVGDRISVDIEVNDASEVKNLALYVEDTLYADNLKSESQEILIDSSPGKVGKRSFYILYTDGSGKQHKAAREIICFSDIEPVQKKAIIQKTYPHAATSYTQGLEFYEGRLFEGTGQYNQSILAEVDLKSGVKVREFQLDGNIFGEGITILNDTIYQITYKSQVCYLYDLDFNQIGEFSYEGEGWGLCNNGKQLLMTNGSDKVVWRNAQTFEIEKTLSVFDKTHSLIYLNELELINGNLFINLYTDENIVEVDTATGKVLSKINCKELVADGRVHGADVLNGIAHNPATGKTYMTGKWWPKLYEVIFE